MSFPFYFHERMLGYDFGARHPLRPERMEQTAAILNDIGMSATDPGVLEINDALRVHSPEYLGALGSVGDDGLAPAGDELILYRHGLGTPDDPLFPNMLDRSLEFAAGTMRAAEAVRDGAPRAMTIAGGLHHASGDKASGFCLISDPSIAIAVLKEKFARVAYMDIDLHHGDGVQAIWYDDPTVLTLSIHQDGRTLFPGTGFVSETGADFSSINIPLPPGTTGDPWLWAFKTIAERAVERFSPQAIVLQMGADPHILDPLGHLNVTIECWLDAVTWVRDLDLPLVACGGGGYHVPTVVKQWTAAVCILQGLSPEDVWDDGLRAKWGFRSLLADDAPVPSPYGRPEAEAVVEWHDKHTFAQVAQS